ncbi:MAG TPA: hypothetical protein VHQ47_11925 [Phycisphaerae bacterium]|jgi:hypothetical protein|nr:hypothetical protein [Phycisphaerae bacterium]
MRTLLAMVAAGAFMISVSAAFTGCDRTATTEETHTESTPNGAQVEKTTKSTNLDTGDTSVTKEKKEVTSNP